MDLKKLFSGEIKPNVYLIPSSEDLSNLPTLAQKHDYALFIFDGKFIHDKDEFLDQFEQVMKPPKHGRNWDSFEEHFRFASWIKSRGIVVVYKDFQYFMQSDKNDFDRSDFEILIDIFMNMPIQRAIMKERRNLQFLPFYVLLQGDDGDQLPVEQLPAQSLNDQPDT